MKALAAALVAAQQEMPAVEKDATNPHFGSRFVSLDHLIAKTKPVLNKHGLAIAQFPSESDGAPALTTMLIHSESGDQIAYTLPLVLAKQDMQGLGGALTYARRYAWAAVLGICDESDDDGNAASAPGTGAPQASDSAGEQKAAASSPSPSGSAVATSSDGWTWPFGKHKGKSLADTPAEYLEWFLEKSDKEDIKQRIREFQTVGALADTGGSFYDADPDAGIPFDKTIDGLN